MRTAVILAALAVTITVGTIAMLHMPPDNIIGAIFCATVTMLVAGILIVEI